MVGKVRQRRHEGNFKTFSLILKELMRILDSPRRCHLQWKIGYHLPQLENSTRQLLLLISILVNEKPS
jgi:hypothetical protein